MEMKKTHLERKKDCRGVSSNSQKKIRNLFYKKKNWNGESSKIKLPTSLYFMVT